MSVGTASRLDKLLNLIEGSFTPLVCHIRADRCKWHARSCVMSLDEIDLPEKDAACRRGNIRNMQGCGAASGKYGQVAPPAAALSATKGST